MPSLSLRQSFGRLLALALFGIYLIHPMPSALGADSDSGDAVQAAPDAPPTTTKKRKRREYVSDVEHGDRSDAGIFHVGFAAGGNYYIEPQLSQGTDGTTSTTGNYYMDFGGQAGVFFDYDYSEAEENIPLMLRGMIGYKYVLSTTHVFAFDFVARRMFTLSERAKFGLGMGGSASLWYRPASSAALFQQMVFLPSFVMEAGFDFNPFMVEFKWLTNRIGSDDTLLGLELYFGVRL